MYLCHESFCHVGSKIGWMPDSISVPKLSQFASGFVQKVWNTEVGGYMIVAGCAAP
jgi:hypothetical protein